MEDFTQQMKGETMVTDGTLSHCINAMLSQVWGSTQSFAIMVNLNDETNFRLMSRPLSDTGYVYPEDTHWFVTGLFTRDTVENALQMYHMHYVGQRVRAIFGERSSGRNDLPK